MKASYPMSPRMRDKQYGPDHREYHNDKKLGAYYVDKEGRKIFTNDNGQEYYVGVFNGKPQDIIVLPGYIPVVRPRADIGGAQPIGNGAYRNGGVGGNN